MFVKLVQLLISDATISLGLASLPLLTQTGKVDAGEIPYMLDELSLAVATRNFLLFAYRIDNVQNIIAFFAALSAFNLFVASVISLTVCSYASCWPECESQGTEGREFSMVVNNSAAVVAISLWSAGSNTICMVILYSLLST